jgi:hypothetical protein
MNMLLAIDNQPVRSRESAIPALRGVAEAILVQLADGRIDDAVRFMSRQHLSPIALGFVATCLLRQGIGEKEIEAVLLH